MNVSLSKIIKSCGLEAAFLENGYVPSKNKSVICFTRTSYNYFIFSIPTNEQNIINIDEQILDNYGTVLKGWKREININNIEYLVEKFKNEWFEILNKLGGVNNLSIDDIDNYLLNKFHRNNFIRKTKSPKKIKIQLYDEYPNQLFDNDIIDYQMDSDYLIRFVINLPFPTIQFINLKSEKNKQKSFYWNSFCNPYCKDYEILDLFIEKADQFNFNDNFK